MKKSAPPCRHQPYGRRFIGSRLATKRTRSKTKKNVSHEPEANPCNLGCSDICRTMRARRNCENEPCLTAGMFDYMKEAVVVTDAENRYVLVNPAFTSITGYELDEVRGRNPRIMASGMHDAAFFEQMWAAIGREGSWHGEIWDRRKNGELFPKWLSIGTVKDNWGAVKNYFGIFSDISESKDADEQIHFMTNYDPLTGLPNKVLLHDRIDQAIRSAPRLKRSVGILLLDLDRFKNINDTLGHSVGDLLLQSVAQRLTNCIRSSDTVAHLSGDGFVVVIPDLANAEYAATVAQNILRSFSAPFEIKGSELHATTSIGISIFPNDGSSIDAIISHAEVALYRSKESGRGAYQFFTPDMNASNFERLSMENSLHRALEGREFVLFYQPQVNSETGAIIGAEALIRWQHPEMGLVPPGKFIPLAEESGLIVPIGEWAMLEACRQNRAWQDEGLPPIPVAVNLSALQFRQNNLTEQVAGALSEVGLEPRWLELEITESAVMRNAEEAIATLRSLKQMGVKISIDDFGTGYSSLSHLKRFPLDKLKIDQSFVRDIATDPDNAAIVAAIIGLAHSLKLDSIAEGVETREQLDLLTSLGCPEIQGYFYSRPVPADQFRQMLSQALATKAPQRDPGEAAAPVPTTSGAAMSTPCEVPPQVTVPPLPPEEPANRQADFYLTLFETFPAMVWRAGTDKRCNYLNEAWLKFTGRRYDQEIGKAWAEGMHPDDQERCLAIYLQAFDRREPFQMEHRLRHHDGEYRWVVNFGRPFKDRDGDFAGYIGSSYDITDRKNAEGEILRLNRELTLKVEERTAQLLEAQEELVRADKLSILGRLSGSVGHELRNPLGVMSNAVYFLKMVLSDADETTREYLDIIKNEIENSERIITDLLDFARTKTPQTKAVTACELIAQSLARCGIPENVELSNEVPQELPPVTVDPLQIGQVLQNLVMNAVQAMPDGGSLRFTAQRAAASPEAPPQDTDCETVNLLAISVTDTGEGIAPEHMKKLFQPLFTTKAKGIGLGLVVCRNLVEANGGRIEVESEPGHGTTFRLLLPYSAV